MAPSIRLWSSLIAVSSLESPVRWAASALLGGRAENKIRIVLSGLRGEYAIAELCRPKGMAENMYYSGAAATSVVGGRVRGISNGMDDRWIPVPPPASRLPRQSFMAAGLIDDRHAGESTTKVVTAICGAWSWRLWRSTGAPT